jgi:hypothetical protein
MKWLYFICTSLFFISCKSETEQTKFQWEKELPKDFKEISGITKDGDAIWAVTDKPNAIHSFDLSGNQKDQIPLKNISMMDVEAITADDTYLYIGDFGNNDGDRLQRSIIRMAKKDHTATDDTSMQAQTISFTFPGDHEVDKKKENNFDCEAMVSYKDSLYLFTKRRGDMQTELYVLPKTPGQYEARRIAEFNSDGMITDAAVNPAGNELALIGYDKGHTKPFIWIFSNFRGSDFFSGNPQRYFLGTKKKQDWQVEGISYADDQNFYISCEKSKDIPNTLYLLDRSALTPSKK